jgi:hypothetical protein
VLVETHDEWEVSERSYLSEGSMALLDKATDTTQEVAPPARTTFGMSVRHKGIRTVAYRARNA